MRICEFGCGQEATYRFKNGKWCCSKSHNKCSAVRDQMRKQPYRTTKRTEESKRKQGETSKRNGSTKGERNGMFGKRGKLNPFYGKNHTEEQCKKWKKERSNIKYKQLMSELMRGLWKEEWFRKTHTKYTLEEVRDLKSYYYVVWQYTRQSYREFSAFINPHNKILSYQTYHIDHIFSIIDGFRNKVDPRIIGSTVNLQVLPKLENIRKNRSSWISLKNLEEKYQQYENNI